MPDYNKEEVKRIEEKWRAAWAHRGVYKVTMDPTRPKCYVLDMFPYPSGAGLHVGHPLGYIASDIYARFMRLKGFNVLHPMGFDAFGLPAEQYAIDHGIHPAQSTAENIENFKRQMAKLGFCYDWSREVQTCDPKYYRWTQWIFLQIFDSWFNRKTQRAARIGELVQIFETEGNANHPVADAKFRLQQFDAATWKALGEEEKQEVLMQYRLAYLAYTDVNWCEALGTVLANDEVINGVSYRGGHPVVKRQMRQWALRITEYAERLLEGLERVDFSESMKEIQRNWIGKSVGALIDFRVAPHAPLPTDGASAAATNEVPAVSAGFQHTVNPHETMAAPSAPLAGAGPGDVIRVFTTRPDTIFGVDFLVLAPEHDLVKKITTARQRPELEKYLTYVQSRSEVDRMAEVKKITGAFTGAFAVNPVNGRAVPVWVSEYVLAGYGTGAIMAVPCGDARDHQFARHFGIPITNIIGKHYTGEQANPTKEAVLENSGFLDGLVMHRAMDVVMNELEHRGLGRRQVNYKMRDAGWSRQRYWGEPFPVVFKNDLPYPMSDSALPLELPPSNNFKPSGTGEGPLANLTDWIHFAPGQKRDSNTMPTHAGAAWYFLRYMDPHNETAFAGSAALNYWGQVDVYVGGAEHAVAHLLYARLWVKILHDLGYLPFDEPFKKLINQGKITGDSRFVYRVRGTDQYVSAGLKDNYETDPLRVDVKLVSGLELDTEALRQWKPEFAKATFMLENGSYLCGAAIEKMSKSYFNVVSPDEIVDHYGADTLRMYEMFLGPLEASKPWSTQGIDGVFKFLRRFWNLFHDGNGGWRVTDAEPTAKELKVLHRTLKKIEHDILSFSFNTCVSEWMICANELTALGCSKRAVLEPLVVALAPFAPHLAEELWEKLGHADTVFGAAYPPYNEHYLAETAFDYPISVNGKVRAQINFALDLRPEEIERAVLNNETVKKWTGGNPPKKVIVVPGKIVNVVV